MINNGSKMLLKLKIDEDLEHFTTLAGMRTTRFIFNNQIVDSTNKDSGQWREIMAEVGISSLSISASGIFTNTCSEEIMRKNCFEQKIKFYKLHFANGEILTGNFFISSYERSGNYGEEETYAITLESSGIIKYLKG